LDIETVIYCMWKVHIGAYLNCLASFLRALRRKRARERWSPKYRSSIDTTVLIIMTTDGVLTLFWL
jgi:hypothetical protein